MKRSKQPNLLCTDLMMHPSIFLSQKALLFSSLFIIHPVIQFYRKKGRIRAHSRKFLLDFSILIETKTKEQILLAGSMQKRANEKMSAMSSSIIISITIHQPNNQHPQKRKRKNKEFSIKVKSNLWICVFLKTH